MLHVPCGHMVFRGAGDIEVSGGHGLAAPSCGVHTKVVMGEYIR